jgi:5-methylcytosine-specific restriction endonuclease McrA
MENNCKYCGTETIFVKYEMSNKRIQLRKQCFNCGYLNTTNYKHSLFENLENIPFYSKENRDNFKNNRINNSKLRNNIGSKDYYNEVYLKSFEWKNKRENILKRDNYKCVCCNSDATQVHHINYNNVYLENFTDLISVCYNCHQKIHFLGEVYFNNLKANFGILKYCNSCKNYHNNNLPINFTFCNNCLKKNNQC